MAWLYILKLSNNKFYIGSTRNLSRRIAEHTLGNSSYTKKFLPIKLVFSQEYETFSQANKMEKYLKKLKNHQVIEKVIILKSLQFG